MRQISAAPEGYKVIYLAGGFKSGWQDLVTNRLDGYRFLDPRSHNMNNPSEYTRWDLDAVQQSDIVFANMEASNPGGYALALEIGFAKALGKIIVFVDQIVDQRVSAYFEMVRQCSDHIFLSLDDAIAHLSVASNVRSSGEWP